MKKSIIVLFIAVLFSFASWSALAQEAHKAIDEGQVQKLKQILSEKPELLESRDSHKLTPLLLASMLGKTEACRVLLSLGADMEAVDSQGSSALHNAASNGHEKIVELLLERGAKRDATNQFGLTPLTFAIWRNHQEVATLLIAGGANVSLRDRKGNAPLHLVCLNDQPSVAKSLIAHGADINLKDRQGMMPIQLAAMNGCNDIVRMLLAKGVDVSSADPGGDTPLHGAAWRGRQATMELLITRGADKNARNVQGKTPLDYALQAGHVEAAKWLQSRGALADHQKSTLPLDKDETKVKSARDRLPVKLTVLYDNTKAESDSRAEWGFSCLIEEPGTTTLFDTGGEEEVLMHNVNYLDVDLNRVDQVVISHNHWDHIGGLAPILLSDRHPPVYIPRSFPYSFIRSVEKAGSKAVAVNEPIEISPNLYSTGEMGTSIKEHSLILDTPGGLVVVTGCSHQGIALIVERARELLGKEILLVVGGFHLMRHSDEQVAEIIKTFRDCGVKKCGATHCTGEHQIDLFREAFGEDYISIGSGRRILVTDQGVEVL